MSGSRVYRASARFWRGGRRHARQIACRFDQSSERAILKLPAFIVVVPHRRNRDGDHPTAEWTAQQITFVALAPPRMVQVNPSKSPSSATCCGRDFVPLDDRGVGIEPECPNRGAK